MKGERALNHRGFYQAMRYIVYITQLGLSMVVPMVVCIWLANWLKEAFHLGDWVLIVFILLGVASAFTSLIKTLNMTLLKPKKGDDNTES